MASTVGLPDWSGVAIGAAHEGEVAILVREIDGERAAVLVPRGIQKLGDEGFECMRDMQELVHRLADLSEQLDVRVEEARLLGMSWDSIGFCVGTTGEAARQRFGVERD